MRKNTEMMAGNLTEPGMENFYIRGGYDRGSPNYLIAKTNNKHVPPSGNNTYAPGSPKPNMRDTLQHKGIPFAESKSDFARQQNPRLKFSPSPYASDEMRKERFDIMENNKDQSSKDAHIANLNQIVSVLQAKLCQSEQLREQSEIALKEKDQTDGEAHRLKEQLAVLLRENGHQMMIIKQKSEEIAHLKQYFKPSNEQLESYAYSGLNEKDDRISKLTNENSSLKRKVDSLSSELGMCRESMSATSHSPNHTVNNSVMSSQGCSKELESLHYMVDRLKSAVLQQRDVLRKIKTPQTSSSLSSVSKQPSTSQTNNNMAAVVPSQSFLRLRQGEEGTDLDNIMDLDLDIVGKSCETPVLLPHSNASSTSQARGTVGFQHELELVGKRHQDSMMQLARVCEGSHASASLLQGSAYLNNTGDDVVKMNNDHFVANGADLLCLKPTDLGFYAPAHPSKFAHNVCTKNSSTKEDIVPVQQNIKDEASQNKPMRKFSRSEIIYQPPPSQNVMPMRSKTENFGCNPRIKAQLQPDFNRPQQPMEQPVVLNLQQASHAGQPATWPPTIGQRSPASSKVAAQPSIQTSHHMPYLPPLDSSSSTGTHYMTGSVVRSIGLMASGHLNASKASNVNSFDSPFSQPSREHVSSDANSDRLCPACNLDFGSVSIDQFQSHILECLDNETGPDTMIADDSGPQRLCPMCNTSFGDNMPQSEYEKHVHSHFGEEPGENFEVLQP